MRIGIQINHQLRRICQQGSSVILHAVDVQHDPHDAGLVLGHAYRGEQIAIHVNILPRQFRSKPGRVQIKENAVRIRNTPRGVLYAVF